MRRASWPAHQLSWDAEMLDQDRHRPIDEERIVTGTDTFQCEEAKVVDDVVCDDDVATQKLHAGAGWLGQLVVVSPDLTLDLPDVFGGERWDDHDDDLIALGAKIM